MILVNFLAHYMFVVQALVFGSSAITSGVTQTNSSVAAACTPLNQLAMTR